MELMCLRDSERIPEMYGFFHKFPESSAFAGWHFEAIVHRLFSGGWTLGTVPQPIPMDCKGPPNSPLFSTDPPSSAPDTRCHHYVPTTGVSRKSTSPPANSVM